MGRRTRTRNCDVNSGESNGQWKGEKVSYSSLHQWINYNYAKPDNCPYCGKKAKLDLCNISGEYNRNLENWTHMCRQCHSCYDRDATPKPKRTKRHEYYIKHYQKGRRGKYEI